MQHPNSLTKIETHKMDVDNPTAVISPDLCLSEQVHLTILRKILSVKDGNFLVTDEKGNKVFEIKEKLFTIHNRHVLFDAQETPIVTLKKKILSAHKRWLVFRGDSSKSADLLFSAKKSSPIQFKTELDVFLSGNNEESSWDFKVVGSWFERSCIIYNKNSTPIAKMQKKHTFGSVVLGKDTFDVSILPRVDYAFITALIVILYEINKDNDD